MSETTNRLRPQSEPGDEAATSYVDDVGSVFYMYHEHEDNRECICADLADAGADAMARQFDQAEDILRGLLGSAEHISLGFYLCVSDALDRARTAREAAERYAR